MPVLFPWILRYKKKKRNCYYTLFYGDYKFGKDIINEFCFITYGDIYFLS